MKYNLTDYQGNEIQLTPQQAQAVADEAGLLEITVNGQTHYISKSHIASIKPASPEINHKQLPRPDFRGEYSPAKEKLRAQLNR